MKLGGSSLLSISRKHSRINIYSKHPAFTIVELLVVIVVIGILATITVVSYSGISQKASLASLQSDLANAANKLKAYQVIYGSYPTLDASNCPSAPAVDVNYCLKFSPSSSIATTPFAGYVVNNTTTPKTFSLTLTNNDRQGVVTESSKPSILTPAPLDPVADWIATPQGDHYGNYYDPVSKSWATVTRSTPKTIYDPATQHIYDVPANYLAINPWSAYQPGGNGSAAVIEEARTNYLTNSSLEVDSDGNGMADGIGGPWGPGISYFSKQLVSGTNAPHGDKYQQFADITASSSTVFQIYTGQKYNFSAGESATCSAYVSGSSEGVSFMIRARAYQDNTSLGEVGPTVALTNNFTKVEANYSSLPLNTNSVMCLYQFNSVDPGDSPVLNLEAIQLEKGAFATSYIPTTTGIITRSKDTVTIPASNWNTNTGTVLGLIGGKTISSGVSSIMTWRALATDRITIGTTTNSVTSTIDGSDTEFSATKAGDGTIPLVASVKWKAGNNVIAYMNGIGGTPLGPVVSPIYIDSAFIGSYIASHSFANEAPISRLIVYPSALPDSQIVSLNSLLKGP